jgi:hypothetical protein
MQLFNVLKPEELQVINEIFHRIDWNETQDPNLGDSPKQTFEEVTARDAELIPVIKILERIFYTTIVKNFVFCKDILSVKGQRFKEGEGRGKLIEESHILSYKCDLSWAIFINGKESYEGGEFVVNSGGYSRKVNLEPGGMVIYKTGSATKISAVTKGEKVIMCGGIESFIPSYQSREALYKLSETNEILRRATEEDDIEIKRSDADKMNQAWHQLVRLLSTQRQ